MSTFELRLKTLLTSYDYKFIDGILISKGIKGFTQDREIGKFKSMFAAAEFLLPICDNEYKTRFHRIVSA